MSRSVSGTKMGVQRDLLWLEGINMANMPIIVDPLPKSAINRNSWILHVYATNDKNRCPWAIFTVKVSESWKIVSLKQFQLSTSIYIQLKASNVLICPDNKHFLFPEIDCSSELLERTIFRMHIGMFAVTSHLGLVGREATTVTPFWPGKSVVFTRVCQLPELVFSLLIKI